MSVGCGGTQGLERDLKEDLLPPIASISLAYFNKKLTHHITDSRAGAGKTKKMHGPQTQWIPSIRMEEELTAAQRASMGKAGGGGLPPSCPRLLVF